MKLIIDIDDDIAKGIRGENDCKVEPREIVRNCWNCGAKMKNG